MKGYTFPEKIVSSELYNKQYKTIRSTKNIYLYERFINRKFLKELLYLLLVLSVVAPYMLSYAPGFYAYT